MEEAVGILCRFKGLLMTPVGLMARRALGEPLSATGSRYPSGSSFWGAPSTARSASGECFASANDRHKAHATD